MAEIEVKDVPAMTVMSLAFTGPYDQTGDRLDQLMSWLLRIGHPYSAPPMGVYYDDPAKTASEDLRAEVCLPIEEECEPAEEFDRKELPAATMACALHKGPYTGIAGLYEEIFAWIGENGYQYVEGQPTRELFINLPGQTLDPEEYLTEVQVPVEKTAE